jgi:hypothetical protein
MMQETQESRRDTVSAAVTAKEKWQLQLVAKKDGRPLSELLRDNTLADLIERGRRIEEVIEALPESASAA